MKVKSFLRLHRLTTIPAELIRRKLGQIPKTKDEGTFTITTFATCGLLINLLILRKKISLET